MVYLLIGASVFFFVFLKHSTILWLPVPQYNELEKQKQTGCSSPLGLLLGKVAVYLGIPLRLENGSMGCCSVMCCAASRVVFFTLVKPSMGLHRGLVVEHKK